jgi:hypothetical protein
MKNAIVKISRLSDVKVFKVAPMADTMTNLGERALIGLMQDRPAFYVAIEKRQYEIHFQHLLEAILMAEHEEAKAEREKAKLEIVEA